MLVYSGSFLFIVSVLWIYINLLYISDAEDFHPAAPVVKAEPLKNQWVDEDVEEEDVKDSWEEEEEEVLRKSIPMFLRSILGSITYIPLFWFFDLGICT